VCVLDFILYSIYIVYCIFYKTPHRVGKSESRAGIRDAVCTQKAQTLKSVYRKEKIFQCLKEEKRILMMKMKMKMECFHPGKYE